MDRSEFIKHFELLVGTSNAVAKLQQLVLGLAFQGKFSADVPSEKIFALPEPQSDEGKSLVAPEEDETPFEIPATWRWLRFGQVFDIQGGTQPPKSTFVNTPRKNYVRLVQIRDLGPKPVPTYVPMSDKLRVCTIDDVMLARYGASVGKIFMGQDGAYNVALTKLIFDHSAIYKRFVYWLLQSSLFQDVLREMSRSAQAGFNKGDIFPIPLPFPPLAEQKRIAAKVDELMALCDELETRQQVRREARARLQQSALHHLAEAREPEALATHWHRVRENFHLLHETADSVAELRKTILQLAVKGKLVPQDPNDEPAEDLIARIAESRRAKNVTEYAPVTPEEAPYEVPSSWSWVRLGNISFTSDSGWSPQCLPEPRSGTDWGVLKVSAVSWGVFKPDENKALPPGRTGRPDCEVKAGDFLLSRANTEELVARSVVVDQTPPGLMMSDKIVRFTFPDEIEKVFINLANSSEPSRSYYARNASGTSSSMKNIGREVMCNLPISLPPRAEQRRIVAKVNELMRLCDELENKLAQSNALGEQLLDSTVQHLLAS